MAFVKLSAQRRATSSGRPRWRLRRALLCSLVPAIVAAPVTGHAGSLAESAFLETLPLVLSAARLPQALHTVPAAVTVIDRELIAATGYRDLARIFRLIPGMQSGQERGHNHWVTYHGLSNDFPTEMQVLIDGRSVISPSAFGGIDWAALPIALDDIERIEVVRGTNANSFGANAFLGVINIITVHSGEARPTTVAARLGNRGIRDAALAWGRTGTPLSLRVSAEAERDDGFQGLSDSRRMDKLAVRADLRLSAMDTMMLRTSASAGVRSDGYRGSVFNNNGVRNSRNAAHGVHLQWRRSAAPGDEWLLSYHRTVEKIRDRWMAQAPSFGYADVPLDRDRRSERDNLELQHRLTAGPQVQLVWGAEARRDRVDAPFLFHTGNPAPQHLYRLFGNFEWLASDRLAINVGGVQEKYSTAERRFSPRVHANFQAGAGHTLRAGYARAWRQHNLFELFGDIRAIDPPSGDVLVRPFLPNPALRQARVDTLELGYRGRFARWNTTLDARLFNERIRDFVVRAPQPHPDPEPALAAFLGSARYENLDRPITLRGLEYEVVARPRPRTQLRLTHTLIARRFGERRIDDRSAPYNASASWLEDYGNGWSSMLSIMRMGPLAGGDGFVPGFEYVARPYTSLDAAVHYRGRLGGAPMRISLTALNLGRRHQEIADRAQQATHPAKPLNRASRVVYLTLAVSLD